MKKKTKELVAELFKLAGNFLLCKKILFLSKKNCLPKKIGGQKICLAKNKSLAKTKLWLQKNVGQPHFWDKKKYLLKNNFLSLKI